MSEHVFVLKLNIEFHDDRILNKRGILQYLRCLNGCYKVVILVQIYITFCIDLDLFHRSFYLLFINVHFEEARLDLYIIMNKYKLSCIHS